MTDTALMPLDGIETALATASTVEDFGRIRDVATAARAWAVSRNMGIEAENRASEFILRAERGMGQSLNSLREQGKYDAGMAPPAPLLIRVAEEVRFAPRTTAEVADAVGSKRQTVASTFASHPELFQMHPNRVRSNIRWSLKPDAYADWLRQREGLVFRADLGISVKQAREFQLLARLDDAQFESMLGSAKEAGYRIAKTNFYYPDKEARKRARNGPTEVEAAQEPAFVLFRDGVRALVGWTVDEEGFGQPSDDNPMVRMPADDLAEIAELVRLLAGAYQKVRAQRA
jgi:hypothetical protein